MPKADEKKPRPGVKPTQYRLEPPILSKLDTLVDIYTAENGTQENRTSVLRRLIVGEHQRRTGTQPPSAGER